MALEQHAICYQIISRRNVLQYLSKNCAYTILMHLNIYIYTEEILVNYIMIIAYLNDMGKDRTTI
jgi:hypothetical protein